MLTLDPPGAHLTSRDEIGFYIQYDPLAFYVSNGEASQLFVDNIAIAVQKDSPLKNVFDKL